MHLVPWAAACEAGPPGSNSMPGCTAGRGKQARAPAGPLEDGLGAWLLMATCSWLGSRTAYYLCLWAPLAPRGS